MRPEEPSAPAEPQGQAGASAVARLLRISDQALTAVEAALLVASLVAMFVMMVVISVDAVGRYLFNNPLALAYDTVLLYLLPATMLFALSYTYRRGGHVTVEVIAQLLPQRVLVLLFGLSLLAAVGLLAIILERTGNLTLESWRLGETTFGVHSWLVWPSKITVPVGIGVLTLRLVHSAAANIAAALSGDMSLAYPAIGASAEEVGEERAV